MFKEFLYYYKMYRPKYGWLWSIEYARFNGVQKILPQGC